MRRMHAREHDRPWAFGACGAGIGVGVLFKYPIGILAPLIMLLSLGRARPHRWRDAALIAAGVGLPVIVCAATLWTQGALTSLLTSQFRYISSYTGGQGRAYGYLTLLSVALRRLSWQTLLLWLGTALASECSLQSLQHPRTEAPAAIVVWFLAAAFSYASQAKGFAYHAQAMLAPLALLTVFLTGDVAIKVRGRSGQLAAVALLEMALLMPAFGYARQMLRSQAWDAGRVALSHGLDYGAIARVSRVDDSGEPGFSFYAEYRAARYISARIPVSVPIFVWGFEPTVYFVAERPLASRFVYNLQLYGDWSWPELREQLLADLAANPPAYIVVASDDALPLVTGTMEDSAAALQGFAELKALVDAQYEYEMSFDNLALYRRLP